MEQAESNPDSLRVFATGKWFVPLGMAARGMACSSKCAIAGRIAMQVPAFKLPACSRVTDYSQSDTSSFTAAGEDPDPASRIALHHFEAGPSSSNTRGVAHERDEHAQR